MMCLQSTDANVRVWDLSDPEKHPKPTFRDISNSKVRGCGRLLSSGQIPGRDLHTNILFVFGF